jgi:hypothetical protein
MTEAAVSRCCDLLADLLNANMSDAGVPSNLRAFLECFETLAPAEQEEVRRVVTEPEARKIASLGVAAAEQALRERDPKWLAWSIKAHDLEQFREDPRNNLRLLAVTNYAAEQLGIDPRELFNRVADTTSSRTASYVRAFADRAPPLRSLATMGVRVVTSNDGPRFAFD